MTKEQKMFAHVDCWQTSGLSIVEYAKKIGVHKEAFRYWIRKKREITKNKDDSVSFIELSSINAMPVKSSKIFSDNDTSTDLNPVIVLTFPGGMCLKIYQ